MSSIINIKKSDLSLPRAGCSLSVWRNLLLVAAGEDNPIDQGASFPISRNTEMFDLDLNQVKSYISCIEGRYAHGVVVLRERTSVPSGILEIGSTIVSGGSSKLRDENPLRSLEYWNNDENYYIPINLPPMPIGLCGFGNFCVNGQLYAVGGTFGHKNRNGTSGYEPWPGCMVLDLASGSWFYQLTDGARLRASPNDPWLNGAESWLAPPRRQAAVFLVEDRWVFYVGGSGFDSISTYAIDVFHVEGEKLKLSEADRKLREQINDLPIPVYGPAFAKVGKKLLVLGGYVELPRAPGEYDFVSDAIQGLDLDTYEWKVIGNLQVPRYRAGAAVLGDTIYVAGGDHKRNPLAGPERAEKSTIESFRVV